MIKAVIDTNILVSALLSPGGKPSQVMQMVFDGRIFPVVSKAVLEEYQGVLSRKKFGFSAADLNAFLFFMGKDVFECVDSSGFHDNVPEDDIIFIAAAVSGGADFIITGNIKHFPGKKYGNARVVTPAEFLEIS
jgi:putative PIN family toxin of toxin-antitoxin system